MFVLLVIYLEDWWALAVVSMLVLARFFNIIIIRRRAAMGWKGASEPGTQGDLLILLSADRWIRMRGAVDDLKAITSGQWLREPTFIESSLTAFSTLLLYLDAALAGNAKQDGKLLLLVLLFCSVGLLGLANQYTDKFKMYDRLVQVKGEPQKFARRLDLAKKLIKETGREDWAIRLGMIAPTKTSEAMDEDVGPKTM
ncbi:hypothetical protein EJ03DRAFT_67604 [Teratosphaeria nubilosa]|uniref:Uncharacterized protein n=1 Tax=Teratosphaeria nubilosa TaxID=161662 RepID=A0A6G1LCV6_9PEZI|nr:hypothetical protein EJ03DRAFT_67604 [Teratosphaeria nubilosa]